MKKKTYISGKITGLDEEHCKEMFLDAYNHIVFKGEEQPKLPIYITPFESKYKWVNKLLSEWLCHMISDIRILVKCDKIAMLSNWKNSTGAVIEWCIAKLMRIKIEYYEYK